MLDFLELSKDGTKFEQLVREILLKKGLNPHWTGKGPDSGRDLLVEEILTGKIQNHKRLWLVDCKHYGHSGKTVGVNDITDIRDRCDRVNANGFLLVCSTTISSELSRKLKEISNNNPIATEVWDSVTLEKLLFTPVSYCIAQQFFPISMKYPAWKMFYTDREERWMSHFKGYFLYIESRAGIEPPPLSHLEIIIHELENVNLGENECLRIRAIWHDTPNGLYYTVAADYMVSCEKIPVLKPSDIQEQLNVYCVDGGYITWHIRLQITIPLSDYYSLNDPEFYEIFKQPLYHAFFKIGQLSEMSKECNKWINQTPPPIKTVVDNSLWDKNKKKFGYTNHGMRIVEF